MKGAFDSAATIIIVVVSVLMIVMTLSIVTLMYSQGGELKADSSMQAIVEEYKRGYQAHMTMAALTGNFEFRNATGYYLANGKSRLKSDVIIPEGNKIIPRQSSIHIFSVGDETLFRSGGTVTVPEIPSGPADCPGSLKYVYEDSGDTEFYACAVSENQGGNCPAQSEEGTFNNKEYCLVAGEYSMSASTASHSTMYVASPSPNLAKLSVGVGVQN
ncbi:MAG: hypothetical protein H8Z69_03035 [Nanohaloarchaea archaeon]|nr:hypothetical protein [Candidatus Nanohaloarchaea archaeon]